MDIAREIYVGHTVKDLETIVYSLRRNIPVLGIYCLCVKRSDKCQLEILSSKELFYRRSKNNDYKLLGVASDRCEASEVLVEYLSVKAMAHVDITNVHEMTL